MGAVALRTLDTFASQRVGNTDGRGRGGASVPTILLLYFCEKRKIEIAASPRLSLWHMSSSPASAAAREAVRELLELVAAVDVGASADKVSPGVEALHSHLVAAADEVPVATLFCLGR